MDKRAELVLRILYLGYLVHLKTDYCVFMSFSGHIDRFEASVRASKEDWQTVLFTAERQVIYNELRSNGVESDLAELQSLVSIFEQILDNGDIPYDDMDYEEWAERRYFV